MIIKGVNYVSRQVSTMSLCQTGPPPTRNANMTQTSRVGTECPPYVYDVILDNN